MSAKTKVKGKKRTKRPLEQEAYKIAAQEFYRKALIIQEEEKKRLSRDLHDETGQIVIALGAALNVIEKELSEGNIEKALKIINENRKLIEDIANRMKAMALKLRPPGLDILGLPAVLREYFSQCTKLFPVKIEFTENLKDMKLDENVEIALYRIVQEAIYNIQKHSEATIVKINLILERDELSLFVEDNGRGFDTGQHTKSADTTKMGLQGIKERVAMLGGASSIESSPGKGTKLKINLFLEKLTHGD